MRSRELVLDAAERVMAEHGFEGATLARVVEEAGIPMSSVYHYYGSKDGILLAVMERGAERFFADLPDPDRRTGSAPAEHLATVVSTAADTLERHPNFLRLLIVFAVQPPARRRRRDRGRRRRASASSALRTTARADRDRVRRRPPQPRDHYQLARFALAAIDGAFVASQADRAVTLEDLLEPLGPAVVAVRRALLAKAQ